MNDKELERWERNEAYDAYFRRFDWQARQGTANSTVSPTFIWIPDPHVARVVAAIMDRLCKSVDEVVGG